MSNPTTRPTLTIAALARNESRHLRACFDSLAPLRATQSVDTLIVLDSRADAATAQQARELADHVVVSKFVNFSTQRNCALSASRGDWVFFIDPDERCTPALTAEVTRVMRSDAYAAYRVPRRNILFGHEVKHTGWSPDYQVRLLLREKCRYDESRAVHEVPEVQGATGTLREPLIHYNYETWRQFFRKQRAYAGHEARALYAAGRRVTPKNMLGQPLREFKRRLIDYRGYKDGAMGLALSAAMMLYTAETYRRLWLLQRRAR